MKMVTIEDYAEIRCRGCKKPMGFHMTTSDPFGNWVHNLEAHQVERLQVWCPTCWEKALEMSK